MKFFFTLCSVLIISTNFLHARDITTAQKYHVLKENEKKIFDLPFDFNQIRDVIYPEIISERAVLAPHYPDIAALPRTEEAIKNAFHSWIEDYQTEYNAYYGFLVTYINEHQN